jgi:cytidylate kinase
MLKLTQRNLGIERLVERQMRNWELVKSHVATPYASPPEPYDFVTISRAVGSGGDAIAERLAEKLHWPFFDKQLLLAMANDDEVRARLFASMDERDLNWFERTFRALESAEFRREDYFHRLTETVLYLARKANAVFLGRAADLILPRGAGLRVRIVAPAAECIARIAKQRHLSEKEAAEEIANIEHERELWVQHHFHTGAVQATRFDLIVNVSAFTVDHTLDLIMHAMEKRGIPMAAHVAAV